MKTKKILNLFIPPIIKMAVHKFRKKQEITSETVNSETFSVSEVIEKEALGLKWRLEMSSVIGRSIYKNAIWEPETTNIVLDTVKPGMRALAIGANFGYYAIIMAKQVGPTGHVWAFEPTLKYRTQLEWHIRENNYQDRITVLPYGLSDSTYSALINLSPQSASLHYDLGKNGMEKISLKPLDSVYNELNIKNINFISMDIDGHEASFLKGAKSFFSSEKPIIAMEFAQRCLHFAGSDIREVAKILNEYGYLICSEKTRKPYENELEFLKECGNFNCDANVLVIPEV
jgi:FkbM family methyltransferase